MWIELSDKLAEDITKVKSPMDKSIMVINTLFDSMLKGQHIVFASRELLSYFENHDFISPSNKGFISWIKQKYIYVYECHDIIDFKLIVTSTTSSVKRKDSIFEVPLSYFYEVRETKLLTENENDARLFISIFNIIRKQKRLSTLYDIKVDNASCHGANAASKILQSNSENRITLCILDSDREMKGSARGSTYKGANNAYKEVKKSKVIHLSELGVREKENLMSPNMYLMITDNHKRLLEILEGEIENSKIIMFFDIKDGIKYKKYKIHGWVEYYQSVIDKFIAAGIYNIPQDETEATDDFLCLEGIGDKMCDDVCIILLGEEEISEATMEKMCLSEERKSNIRLKRKHILEIIPDYLVCEWVKIYSIMFSWGCCISESNLPTYGF